jgi:hypothetical protein
MRTNKKLKLIAVGLLSSGAALAQESAPTSGGTPAGTAAQETASPWMIGIRQEFTREDNLFRAPEGGLVVSDNISSTGLTLGVDQPFGRQRFSANVRANTNRYDNNEQLNNTDYSAAARLDWETVERVSGEVSVDTQQSLYRESVGGTISTVRNQLRQSGVALQARVGIVTLWSFEGGVAASENNYIGATVDNRDVRQRSANVGLRWRPSDRLSTRLGVRHSRGTYPNFGTQEDEFKRNDIDLSGSLTPSGASRLDARLSATRERHTFQLDRDSEGWTGALGWNWRATGKLNLHLNLTRDSSVGRTGFDSSLITADSSDARESQAATLAISWDATAKIQVTPTFGFVRRELDSGFSAGGGSLTATDRTTRVGIDVRYQPITAVELACGIQREERRSSSGSPLTSPYTANVASCSAQLAMR